MPIPPTPQHQTSSRYRSGVAFLTVQGSNMLPVGLAVLLTWWTSSTLPSLQGWGQRSGTQHGSPPPRGHLPLSCTLWWPALYDWGCRAQSSSGREKRAITGAGQQRRLQRSREERQAQGNLVPVSEGPPPPWCWGSPAGWSPWAPCPRREMCEAKPDRLVLRPLEREDVQPHSP